MASDNWKTSLRAQLLKLLGADLDFEMDLIPAVQEAICEGKIHGDVGGISWFGARAKVFRQERIEGGENLAKCRVRILQECYDHFLLKAPIGVAPTPGLPNLIRDKGNSAGKLVNAQVAIIFEMLRWKSPSQDHWHWFTKGLSELVSNGWDFDRDLVPLIADAVDNGEVPDTIQSVLWFVKTRDRRLKKRAGRLAGI
jgi:hypothetical protein